MKENRQKVLLHACCAICSAYPINVLKALGYEPLVYFYNPNIYPEIEYKNRLDAQKILCKNLDCEMLEGSYFQDDFFDCVEGLELEPEKGKRCEKCFELRLIQTAKVAKELSIALFTTSIVISPHKNFNLIKEIGENIASKYDLNYLSIDFKKNDGFLKSNKMSKEMNLYRQNYCGCKFSVR